MFETIKSEKTRKFLELKLWFQELQTIASSEDFNKSNKGLFFVYLYGLLEFVVTSTIRDSIDELNNLGININDCSFDLISVALDTDYLKLKNVGRDKKWEKRWDIAEKFKNNIAISIPSDTLPTDGKNIRYKQLESLSKSFGIKSTILPRPDVRGYLEDVVNNRNYIAHGDETPSNVGRKYTFQELQKTYDAISDMCDHVISSYELYFINLEYKR